ncbi:MAG: hypothetical protein J0L57_02500 [Burkholderiales bacterium]|nr:hypothetical protein [Burkholderiales bacterium]
MNALQRTFASGWPLLGHYSSQALYCLTAILALLFFAALPAPAIGQAVSGTTPKTKPYVPPKPIPLTPQAVKELSEREQIERAIADFIGMNAENQRRVIDQRVAALQKQADSVREAEKRISELEKERAALPTDEDYRRAQRQLEDARNKMIKLIIEKTYKTGDASTLKIGMKAEKTAREMYEAQRLQEDAILADDRRVEIANEISKLTDTIEKSKSEMYREGFALLFAKPIADAMVEAERKEAAAQHRARADRLKAALPKVQARASATPPSSTAAPSGGTKNKGGGSRDPGDGTGKLMDRDRSGGAGAGAGAGGDKGGGKNDGGRVDLFDKGTGDHRGGGDIGGVETIGPSKK